jgi:hypothetical protein
VSDLAIRVPSVAELFDGWSIEPLAQRPLSDEVRERILDRWVRARKGRNRISGGPTLELWLPEDEQSDAMAEIIAGAVRNDLRTLAIDSRRHWIRRSLRPRAARIGLLVFFLALTIAAIIDFTWADESGDTLVGQAFVVFGWVALWTPASAMIQAASYRLGHRRFVELADAEIRIVWAQ